MKSQPPKLRNKPLDIDSLCPDLPDHLHPAANYCALYQPRLTVKADLPAIACVTDLWNVAYEHGTSYAFFPPYLLPPLLEELAHPDHFHVPASTPAISYSDYPTPAPLDHEQTEVRTSPRPRYPKAIKDELYRLTRPMHPARRRRLRAIYALFRFKRAWNPFDKRYEFGVRNKALWALFGVSQRTIERDMIWLENRWYLSPLWAGTRRTDKISRTQSLYEVPKSLKHIRFWRATRPFNPKQLRRAFIKKAGHK